MVKLSLFRRPVISPPTDEDLQRIVYDLVRERVLATLGSEGSFSVSIRTGNDADTFFSETFAESIAWEVARRVETRSAPAARLIA